MVKLSLIQFDIYIVETEISWVTDKIVWNEQVNGVGQGGRLQNLLTGTLQDLNYKYDAAGNIVELRDDIAVETSAYGYDTLNRLTSWNLNGTIESYDYNASTGNLETKAGITLTYNDAAHVHAVTSLSNGNTFQYDANGNQTIRVIGADTFNLIYNAENQLIEVKKNGLSIAQFTFDGDGRRVKSVVNGETIYFAGGHYEFNDTTDEVTKYYFAGASTVAVRKYIVPQSQTLNYLLGDHLGSTSLVTSDTGNLLMETRYKPWGEVRYTTPNMTLPTRYTFTGQYSYINDEATDWGNAGFGLMFYNARWYDPAIGRFAQADTVVPGGVQGLDRYAYVNNSPLNYTDPSGHDPWWCGGDDLCMFDWFENNTTTGGEGYFTEYDVTVDPKMNKRERRAIMVALIETGNKLAEVRENGESSSEAFTEVFEPITFTKSENDYIGCVFQNKNAISCSNFTFDDFQSDVNNVVHELGHVFNQLIGGAPNDLGLKYGPWRDSILRPDFGINWQQHPTPPDPSGGEMFADMFVAWVFDAWNTSTNPLIVNKVNIASTDMNPSVTIMMRHLYPIN